jgi:peptidoglycan/LPS O-acetylase OafA/YrhL
MSYTLYLEHLAVIYGLQSAYMVLGLKDQLASLGNIPVTVLACILVAALSSRFLERDLLQFVVSVFKQGRKSQSEQLSKSSA